MPDFLLPDLGEGLTDAEILNWLVSVGDTVTVDQTVVEVETAKASVEVPVPFAGRVTAVFGKPGDRIPVGSPLISVATVNGAGAASQEAVSSEYSGNVLIGYGTSAAPRRRGRVRRSSSPASADLRIEAGLTALAEPASAAPPVNGSVPTPLSERAVSVISPVVRNISADANIDESYRDRLY